MLDKDLQWAENGRPAITPSPSLIGNWLFPSLASPNYIDLQTAIDLARANPVYAVYRVATPFVGDALNFARFAIYVDSTPTFANVVSDASLVIARGPDIITAGLNTVGTLFQVAMPPINGIVQLLNDGRRYLALGMQAFVPTTDWSAGGLDVWLANRPLEPRPSSHPSGY